MRRHWNPLIRCTQALLSVSWKYMVLSNSWMFLGETDSGGEEELWVTLSGSSRLWNGKTVVGGLQRSHGPLTSYCYRWTLTEGNGLSSFEAITVDLVSISLWPWSSHENHECFLMIWGKGVGSNIENSTNRKDPRLKIWKVRKFSLKTWGAPYLDWVLQGL